MSYEPAEAFQCERVREGCGRYKAEYSDPPLCPLAFFFGLLPVPGFVFCLPTLWAEWQYRGRLHASSCAALRVKTLSRGERRAARRARPVVPAEVSAPATTSALMPPSFAGGPRKFIGHVSRLLCHAARIELLCFKRLICTCRLAAQAGGPLWQFLQIFGFLYISWNLAEYKCLSSVGNKDAERGKLGSFQFKACLSTSWFRSFCKKMAQSFFGWRHPDLPMPEPHGYTS